MTKKELEQIRNFAEENFCANENSQIYADDEEFAVTNPWIDHSGRFPLTDEGAVKEWGLEVVVDFIEKAKARLDEPETPDEYPLPILSGFVWKYGDKDLSAWQVDLSEEDRTEIEEILAKYVDQGCSVRNVYNSRFNEAF